MNYVGGFSGGIDSQAAARYMLNRYGPDRVVLVNTRAGEHESQVTNDFVQWYSATIHPVHVIPPLVRDMWVREQTAEKRGLDNAMELTFPMMAAIKGRFPSRKAQFCTEKLKLAPVKRWVEEHYPDGNYERFSGVRRDESDERKDTAYREWEDYFDCECIHPVFDFTKQMCFDYVKAHGELVNPLYALGFTRVGCAPCVNASKDDILNWAQRFPGRIEIVRQYEKSVGRTFYAPMVPGMEINWIDDVVEWAKTSRGGRQQNIFRVLNEPAACESKFGLCE